MTTLVKPRGYIDVLRTEGAAANIVRKANNTKRTISQVLAEEDPDERYVNDPVLGELDAFQRQLYAFGIRLQADEKRHLPASTVQEFIEPVGRGEDDVRFFASNQPQSWVLYPEFINRQLRVVPLPEDQLAEIVSIVTTTDTDLYKTIYLDDPVQTTSPRQLRRVAEGGEIPIAMVLKTFENGVKLNKYGLTIRGTYEVYRRLRLDLFGILLSRVAMQIKLDLTTQGVNTIVNGDGNGNPAPNFNVSTLDSTAPLGPGTVTDPVTNATSTISKGLTYSALLKFRAALFPLTVTTLVGRLNELLQILTLQFPNVDPLSLMALLQQQVGGRDLPVNGSLSMTTNVFGVNMRLVYHPWAPGGMLVGLDKRFALEQLVEQNSALTETDKNIREQLNDIVVSQTTGFDKILTRASATLTFA